MKVILFRSQKIQSYDLDRCLDLYITKIVISVVADTK